MASVAAISTATLLRPPRVHPSPVASASASPLPMHALPLLRRRPRSLTTACAAVQTQGAVRRGAIQRWTPVPVAAIRPATEDESIFLITLDLSGAPALVDAYTTPGQYLPTRVPSGDKRPPAYMCISSAPRSGFHFDLLVRSVTGTTSEQLCKLHVGEFVELGPVTGPGFAIQNINPPAAPETVLLFAVDEGISWLPCLTDYQILLQAGADSFELSLSFKGAIPVAGGANTATPSTVGPPTTYWSNKLCPIRSLIEYGFAASERQSVRLYYAAKDWQSMPYQERFKEWEETGVKVEPITEQIQESFLEHSTLHERIVNPLSVGAVIVASQLLKEVITKVLLDFGVPHDKIITIEWNPEDPFGPNV